MVIEGVELHATPVTDRELLALVTAQQAELAAVYGEDQPQVALQPEIAFTSWRGVEPVLAGLPACGGLSTAEVELI